MLEHDVLIFRAVMDGGFFALYVLWSVVGARFLFRFTPDLIALIKDAISAIRGHAGEMAKLSEKIDAAMKKGLHHP